jgi:5'(3')-deoxyribonucleotidase
MKDSKPTVYFDMDGVLAKYVFYTFEGLFVQYFFRNLPPQTAFVEAIKILFSKGYDVKVLSAYLENSKYALQEKKEWLREWCPGIPESCWVLIPVGVPKGDYLKREGDILIDDYSPNGQSWKEAGGKFLKVSLDAEDSVKERKKHEWNVHPEMTALEIVETVEEMMEA